MKKIDFRIPIIIVLTIILIIMCYFYFKEDNSNNFFNNGNREISNTENVKKSYTVQTTSEIKSALTENIELHATYYLEESYVSENQLVKKGENILKYTNGTYLTAPYDSVITSINTPSVGAQCNNNHYIGISANNALKVELSVSESKISSISLGDEAVIKISSLDDKTYEGVVTNISNTASNGKFTVTIEFENDGNIYIGMTASVSV